MNLQDFLSNRRTLRNIKRFNMESVHHPQNLCDHGYNVATLFYLLCKHKEVHITTEELFMVMNHDFCECFTGDLNLHIKKQVPDYWRNIEECLIPERFLFFTDDGIDYALSHQAHEMFLFADALDAWLYCRDEIKMGNSLLKKALKRYDEKLYDLNYSLFNEIKESLNDN